MRNYFIMFRIKTYGTLGKVICFIFNIIIFFLLERKEKVEERGVNSRRVHIGFTVNKVALVHVSSPILTHSPIGIIPRVIYHFNN